MSDYKSKGEEGEGETSFQKKDWKGGGGQKKGTAALHSWGLGSTEKADVTRIGRKARSAKPSALNKTGPDKKSGKGHLPGKWGGVGWGPPLRRGFVFKSSPPERWK